MANLPRKDGEELLTVAPKVPVRTEVKTFDLTEANEALSQFRNGQLRGAVMLVMPN